MVNAMFPAFLRVLVLVALAAMVVSTQTPSPVVKPSDDKSQNCKVFLRRPLQSSVAMQLSFSLLVARKLFRRRKVKPGELV